MDISRYAVEGYSQLLSYATGSSLSTNQKFGLDSFIVSCFDILHVRFDWMRRRILILDLKLIKNSASLDYHFMP